MPLVRKHTELKATSPARCASPTEAHTWRPSASRRSRSACSAVASLLARRSSSELPERRGQSSTDTGENAASSANAPAPPAVAVYTQRDWMGCADRLSMSCDASYCKSTLGRTDNTMARPGAHGNSDWATRHPSLIAGQKPLTHNNRAV